MKHLTVYKLFESHKKFIVGQKSSKFISYVTNKLNNIKSDAQDIFCDIDNVEVELVEYGNLYLDINLKSDTYINTKDNMEDFNRLIDYMEGIGYEFSRFETSRFKWYYDWRELFHMKNLDNLTIHFENSNWVQEEEEYNV